MPAIVSSNQEGEAATSSSIEPRANRSRSGRAAITLLAGLTALGIGPASVVTPRAHACGGLFCSTAMPVNQAAERIIFAHDKVAKKVTAVVEILYSGPAEKFAWVLPVPGIPTVGVSTSALLDRVQTWTNPTYTLQRNFQGGSCGGAGGSAGPPQAGSPQDSASSADSGPTVTVLAAGAVGPYVYEVIKVDPAMSDPAMVALNWLTANKYEVGALGADVLRPYLRDGLNLLAFKLAKNKMAGSIRPVLLSYDALHPMIPIRPTAVAANRDMGILVFVLATGRSVTTNYKTLELNEAAINWFNPGPTYNEVVTLAANEAGGQGFVTEYAQSIGSRVPLADPVSQERPAIANFRATADGLTSAELVVRTIEAFSSFAQGNFGGPFASRPGGGRVALDGVSDVMAQALVFPAGVAMDDFLAAPRCYLAPFRMAGSFYCEGRPVPSQTIDLTGFNKVAFLTAVEAMVIKPLEDTAKLFASSRYLTRLYTTLSADEMTLDPEFDVNDELGDVSNVHQITLTYTKACFGDVSGPWETTIGGLLVRGMGTTWPVDLSGSKVPFNRRVVQMGPSGPGTVVTDNTAKIAAALGSPMPPPGTGGAPGATGGASGAGGTGAGGTPGAAGAAGTGGVKGTGGAAGTSTGGTAPAASESSGCGCDLGSGAGKTSSGAGLWALFAAFALWWARRRVS